jgi:lipoprotein-anchoring transpeptidase ErfK/SrfK
VNKALYFFMVMVALVTGAHAQGMGRYGSWEEHGDYYNSPSTPPYYDWDYEEEAVDNKPFISPIAPKVVSFPSEELAGTIIINNKTRKLHLTIDYYTAYEYPIAVGRDGFKWSGVEKVSRIVHWPEWIPPKEMLARRPDYPAIMAGGIKNPLGAVAIYLGNTLYRIHGTNDPKTIGDAASSGCFRMYNEHALHLASLVSIGTNVKVY